jgi:hypothetical protein
MAKMKKSSKKKYSPVFGEGINVFKGEVIKTADYNKAHGPVEQPALRSVAAEILAPIEVERCKKCGHLCHCKESCTKQTWTGAIKGAKPVSNKKTDMEHCECKKCECVEKVKIKRKKKMVLKKASLIDLLDRKRFGKGKVTNVNI